MTDKLPAPRTRRWQPLRCGLVDVFFYDSQEFWFRDGRMMLRGNNGTGKSKVLALTLPFLLDGDVSPSRVEPDGDRGKRMEWNLLLGGRYEERLGYLWLEFGRVTEDGEHAFFTVGCALRAAAGRGIADRWFFATSQRPGQDLFFIGPAGSALSRDRLTEAIGQCGQVTQKADHYRRIIDEHMFHLGPERYEALISLLIQLRQPQLSKRPDEDKLSRALSEALAPVDQAVLNDIAAAFHDLEQQREELTALRDTRGHVDRFLGRYRRYAAVAARRQGGELRSATAAYDQAGRDLGNVRTEIAKEQQAEEAASQQLAAVSAELGGLAAAREELAGRPELASLEQAERLADLARRSADSEKKKAENSERLRADRDGRYKTAQADAAKSRDAASRRAAEAASHAAGAGIGPDHAAALIPGGLPGGNEGPGLGAQAAASPAGLLDAMDELRVRSAERAFEDLAGRRTRELAHVRRLAEDSDAADRQMIAARARLAELEGERDSAAGAVAGAEQAVAGAGAGLLADWRAFASGTAELAMPYPDETGLAEWTVTLDGPNPAEAAARAAGARATQALAAGHAGASARASEAAGALAELEDERRRLESGETKRPPVPHTRGDGARDARDGAPLWQLTDFAGECGDAERAGLEAALEASGLLDAWVTPEGRLLDPRTHDVVLTAGESLAGSLASVLRPAVDTDDERARTVAPDTVASLLAGIGLGPSENAVAWVCADGRWRVGPLHGSWAKPAPEYVGAGSREAARRRRLEVLAGQIAAAQQAVELTGRAVAEVEQRQAALERELATQPPDQPLRDAHAAAAGARETLAKAETRAGAQQRATDEARQRAADAASEHEQAAADLKVPPTMGGLREAEAALRSYQSAAHRLLTAMSEHAGKLSVVATWAAELRQAEEDLTQARESSRAAAGEAHEALTRLTTIRESIGATADELRERLEQVKQQVSRLTTERGRLDGAHRKHAEARAHQEGRLEALEAALSREAERRDAAVAAFQRFGETGLLATAVPGLEMPAPPWAPDPAVRLARRAEQELGDVDSGDETWQKVQGDITSRFHELAESLSRHGHHAVAGLDDWFVVSIQFQGREREPGELIEILDQEISYRERLLTAKERELLEEHLVNDVASHLQELISDAEAQVEHMNSELEERPTSTGMRLRLRWQPRADGPAGLPEARARLLRQQAEMWSADDRAAVGGFLQRQIEAVRAQDEQGTWQEHLHKALDYRAWHRFTIERFQDGRWRPATGPASGGERVLTVSLPLFAAASAHYRSAHPQAPRLVMLDEAFAGVDDDARGKCLGLLTTFDLDVMMTSERDWGFYATVPGIATHQLVRRDGVDAVYVTTFEWDGNAPRQVQRAYPAQTAVMTHAPALASNGQAPPNGAGHPPNGDGHWPNGDGHRPPNGDAGLW